MFAGGWGCGRSHAPDVPAVGVRARMRAGVVERSMRGDPQSVTSLVARRPAWPSAS
jgi:hypothetical protein